MYEPSKHVATYFIAGFQYWDGALVIDKLKVGTKLDMVPEFDNPYDPNAIAIYYKGTKLGFMPKSENSIPALLAYYGHNVFKLRVLQVDKKADPWEQVRVGLYVKDARKKK